MIYSCSSVHFFLLLRRTPCSTRTDTLFPYTTHCRSPTLRPHIGAYARNPHPPVRLRQDNQSLGQELGGCLRHVVAGEEPCISHEMRRYLLSPLDRKSTRLNSSH